MGHAQEHRGDQGGWGSGTQRGVGEDEARRSASILGNPLGLSTGSHRHDVIRLVFWKIMLGANWRGRQGEGAAEYQFRG